MLQNILKVSNFFFLVIFPSILSRKLDAINQVTLHKKCLGSNHQLIMLPDYLCIKCNVVYRKYYIKEISCQGIGTVCEENYWQN